MNVTVPDNVDPSTGEVIWSVAADENPDSNSKAGKKRWVILREVGYRIILAVGCLLAIAFLNSYQNWGDDWAGYTLQAHSILRHTIPEYMADGAYIFQHSVNPPGPIAYPWGLPLLLAGEIKLFGESQRAFKLVNVVLFLILVAAIYQLARSILPEPASLAMMAVFAFNPVLLHYCNHVLSEIPFMAATVLTFVFLARGKEGIIKLALLGACAFACFTLRTNGVVVLPAISAWQWITNRRRPIELVAPYISFALFFLLLRQILPDGGESHLKLLRGMTPALFLQNVTTYPVALFDFFTAGHYSLIAGLLLTPVILWGALKTWRVSGHFTVYLLLSLVAFILWPTGGQAYRFMLPLTPFLVLLLFAGAERLPLGRALQFGVPALFLAASVGAAALGKLPHEEWHPLDRESTELFSWIRANTPRDSVMAFFKPRVMLLLGERRSVTETTDDLRTAAYLIYTKKRAWNESQPPLADYQKAAPLTLAFENPNFQVYRINR